MKILVLRVTDSSRHRKCFVRGYMHSLFVSKGLTLLKRRLLRTCKQYDNISKKCNLCLSEKFFIICKKELCSLNKRKELASWCHHRNRFLLKNFMTTWLSHSNAIRLSFCVFLIIHFVYISHNNGFKCLYPPVLKCIGGLLNCLMSLAIFCHTEQICSIKHSMNFIFAPLRNYGWALFEIHSTELELIHV